MYSHIYNNLYQIETLPVPIIDVNKKVQSYTHLQVTKPYIALNSEIYTSLRNQELRMYKNTGYQFYCEDFFVVLSLNAAVRVLFILMLCSDIIKENCNFDYYFNNTHIKSAVLDGGNEIFLANWPNDKHIECNINYYIPVRIPSFPYALLNRSVLCNCEIEAENHFLLESLAACQDLESKLTMYFTVNLAFINYFDNLIDSLEFPILLNRTTYRFYQFLWKHLILNQNYFKHQKH